MDLNSAVDELLARFQARAEAARDKAHRGEALSAQDRIELTRLRAEACELLELAECQPGRGEVN